ncbi:MAG: DUF167 domain-containing protein [Candidatus Paceibacterota bacterium]
MITRIKVHSDSKKTKIEKLSENRFEVWVKEKAENNFANEGMIELLSEYLNKPKNKIIIISGHKRPNKTIEISE